MSTRTYDSYAFVVLFRGDDGVRVKEMLRAAVNPEAGRAVYVRAPEVRGLDFLTALGPLGAGLDGWWQRNILPSSLPVYLIRDEPGLENWILGTDGCWFVTVAAPDRQHGLASLAASVFPVMVDEPELTAQQAMQAFGGRGEVSPIFHPSFPYGREPMRWQRQVPRLDLRDPESNLLPAVHESGTAPYRVGTPSRPPQPISYDVEPATSQDAVPQVPLARDMTGGALREALGKVQSRTHAFRGRFQRAPRAATGPSAGLGHRVNANRPIMAGFASRKGGVGKTTHAAATAATIGEALDGLPDTAALVDGNITNPDSWALNPPPGSATVRTLVSRLTRGQDPPPEQYARTPRLAIYPENRDSEEPYLQGEVDLVAEYLRRRHSFIAVDLPNALPSLTTGGPGTVAAAWLCHCDVVVLPFNADPRARQGLLEYVAALGEDAALSGLPIVAPYILSGNRAIATDPAVLADLGELRRLGVQVVEVPDDEKALLALLRDLPINQASPALRRSYVKLTEVVVAAVLHARRNA